MLVDSNYGIVDNCHTYGSIRVDSSYTCGGGGVGAIASTNMAIIRNCSNSASVTVAGGSYGNAMSVGGIAAMNYYNDRGCYISNCYNAGDIACENGETQCAGGIAGHNYTSNTKVSNSFNVGNVTATNYKGGVVGENASGSFMYECYTIDSVPDSLAISKTAEYMKSDNFVHRLNNNISNMEDSALSDLTCIEWTHNDSINNGYPYHNSILTPMYSFEAPAPVIINGVTATLSFTLDSPKAEATNIVANVTLTGIATEAGTHSINLTSTKGNLIGTAQTVEVIAEQDLTDEPVSKTFSFTMPAQDVDDLVLVNTFEEAPFVGTVNISGAGTGATGEGDYEQGDIVSINAGTRSDYNFSGWTTSSDGVTFANANNAATTFEMPDNDVSITANWTQIEDEEEENVVYTLTKGRNQTWEKDTTEGMSLTCNGDYSKFLRVKVDGIIVDESNYTVK